MAKQRKRTDGDAAPHPPLNERRMTFFLSDSMFRSLRLQSGLIQIANVKHDVVGGEEPLPESPSSIIREAVHHLLDRVIEKKDRSRTPVEWDELFERVRVALERRD